MKLSAAITFFAILSAVFSVRGDNSGQPEGWATCSSIYSAGDYDLTGGNEGSLIVLRSDGTNMRQVIYDAVLTHDVIVFDGKNGEFVLPSYLSFQSLTGKTLIGVNGARLRTEFFVTQEIRDLLDELDVNSLSQSPGDNLGGTLSNGSHVNELRELTIRQALIDFFDDQKEPYRNAGVFAFYGCSNIIIRNLNFVGPGSLDVGGADLLTLYGCDHVWVDHCRFTDGLDGNLDIVANSDFVTVSDCHFRYTDLAYNHPLSNLVSGAMMTGDTPQKCNISWIRCFWDEGCTGRMPITTFGITHLLNCYWDVSNGTCVDAHDLSQVLIENSYFTNKGGRALAVRDDNVKYEWRGSVWQSHPTQQSNAKVDVPYSYAAFDAMSVPGNVSSTAGATLSEPFTRTLSSAPSTVDFGRVYANYPVESRINISSFGNMTPSSVTLIAPDGILLATAPDGDYSSSLLIEAMDDNLLQADVCLRASFSSPGNTELPITVEAGTQTFVIPVTADVVALTGEGVDATLSWPLDRGTASASDAVTAHPEVFGTATMSLGEKIYIHSSQTIDGRALALFNPTEAVNKSVDEECCIIFDVTTAPGYVFVPKKMTFNASRIGTDMCFIDVDYIRDGQSPEKLLNSYQPPRSSNSPAYAEVELPLTKAGEGESLRIKVYLYNMLANKQLALGNVRIEGDAYAADAALKPIATDVADGVIEYFDLLGRPVANPCRGNIYILRRAFGSASLIRY